MVPMPVDVAFVVFACAIAALGWFRGFIAQVAGFGAVVGLWACFDAWYPPVDLALAGLGPAFAEYPYLRKCAGFLSAYFACMFLIFVVEAAIVRRVGALEKGNRMLGVAVGAVKGLLYATALLWMVETALLWRKPPHDPVPSFLSESVAVATLGPFNPARVYSLKEALERGVSRGEVAVGAEGSVRRSDAGEEDPEAPSPELEESSTVRRLFKASPMRRLLEETAGESEWQGRGYGDLVMDPKVREVLGDTGIVELLLGE